MRVKAGPENRSPRSLPFLLPFLLAGPTRSVAKQVPSSIDTLLATVSMRPEQSNLLGSVSYQRYRFATRNVSYMRQEYELLGRVYRYSGYRSVPIELREPRRILTGSPSVLHSTSGSGTNKLVRTSLRVRSRLCCFARKADAFEKNWETKRRFPLDLATTWRRASETASEARVDTCTRLP